MEKHYQNSIIIATTIGISVLVTPLSGGWGIRLSKAFLWLGAGTTICTVVADIKTNKKAQEKAWKERKELKVVEKEFTTLQSQLEGDYAQKQQQLESGWEEIEQLQQEVAIEAANKEEKLQLIKEQAIAEITELLEEKDAELEWAYTEINHLKTLVAKLYKQHCFVGGYAAYIGNKILEVFMQHELLVLPEDNDSYHLMPNGDGRIWVKLGEGIKLYNLQRLNDTILANVAELAKKPIIRSSPGCVEIEFQIASGDAKRHAGLLESDEEVELELDYEWVNEAIANSIHLFVNGDTGSGKDTFIDNFICLSQKILIQETGETPKISINDIKWTGSTEDNIWRINGQEVIPDYFEMEDNLNRPAGQPSRWTIDGLQAMADEVDSVLEATRKATFEGKPHPKRQPTIYILGEAARVVARHKKLATEPMLHSLQLGRSSKKMFIFSGQPPLCDAYGFNKNDLGNATRLYLRENAIRGVEEVGNSTQEKKQLRNQVSAWMNAAIIDKSYNYFGLVKYPGKPAKVVALPPPNYYLNWEVSAVDNDPEISTSIRTPDNPESAIQQELSSYQLSAIAPENAQNEGAESADISEFDACIEDAKLIEQINQIKENGETRITKIIPIVWGCKSGSREYRKARKEYRRLTNE